MDALTGSADARADPIREPGGFSPALWLASALSRASLAQLLLLAGASRLVTLAIATPIDSGEVFTYLEPAHRLAFGHSVVDLEWRYGILGWLLPLMTGALMAAGGWLAPSSTLYLLLPKLAMTAASLITVVFAWRLGARISRLHAQAAGFVAAIWCEFILFAPHVLSDTASVAFVLPAALILTDREGWTKTRLALAGALLAVALGVRFQLAPAVLALALAACGRRLRQAWLPLLAGGLVGLVPSAICDLAMGRFPYGWLLANLQWNLVDDNAARYGTSGPLGLVELAWPRMGFWIAPLVVMAAVGARRFPALGWTAAANFVFHSLIAHKEYRFIWLSIVLAVVLAAIGTVDWWASSTREHDAPARRARLGVLCLAWLVASLDCGLIGDRLEWIKWKPALDLTASLRTDPALCGLALYRYDFVFGGYTYLHRGEPMFSFVDHDTGRPWADLRSHQDVANTVMARDIYANELPSDFEELRCEAGGGERVCLYRRPGGCTTAPSRFAIQAVLRRLDQ